MITEADINKILNEINIFSSSSSFASPLVPYIDKLGGLLNCHPDIDSVFFSSPLFSQNIYTSQINRRGSELQELFVFFKNSKFTDEDYFILDDQSSKRLPVNWSDLKACVFPLRYFGDFLGYLFVSVDVNLEYMSIFAEKIFQKLIPTIVQWFVGYKLYLFKKFSSLEFNVTKGFSSPQGFGQTTKIICESINLYTIILLLYDSKNSSVEVLMNDQTFPADIQRMLSQRHISLSNEKDLCRFFNDLDSSECVESSIFFDQVTSGNKSGKLVKIASILANQFFGEFLLTPGYELEEDKKIIFVCIKNKNEKFPQYEIDFLNNLSNIYSLAFLKDISYETQKMDMDYKDIAQVVSKRIIDDSDLNLEMKIIRQELHLHSCLLLMLDRLDRSFIVEAFSSIFAEEQVGIIQSIIITNQQIIEAGYELNEMHKLKITTVNEYLKILKNCNFNNNDLKVLLESIKDFIVIRSPLFDSFRRLKGFFVFVKNPDQRILHHEHNIIKEFTSKISNALEVRKSIYFDQLTGLANLRKMKPAVVDKLISAEPFSLIICKIINLKEIVIALGDETVDKCMVLLTKLITSEEVNPLNNISVGRNSGEASFIFIFPSINNKKIEKFCKQIIHLISNPLLVDGNTLYLDVNLGICHSTDIWDTDMIFNYSKLALQSIDDRNEYCIFDTEMQTSYQKEKDLEIQIRIALKENQFMAYYQPKVLKNGTIKGYEALVRWDINGEIVSPGVFLWKIEKMGLIQPLFNIVFDKVCCDMQNNPVLENVSINIVPFQLANNDCLDFVIKSIEKYHIDPQKITFEFIETAILNSKYYAMINSFVDRGFRLSLDDFGTGYARYTTLIQLFDKGLINEIKIDKVFVDEIENELNQKFIKTVLLLTEGAKIDLVVEGVERISQFEILATIFPDLIFQGWLISKALPLKSVSGLTNRHVKDILNNE